MSAKPSRRPHATAHTTDAHGGASRHGRARRNLPEIETDARELTPDDEKIFSPPPLPSDPKIVAKIRAGIEEGYTQALAGIGDDWEIVHARLRARLNLPSR